jgi:hypothetical protein
MSKAEETLNFDMNRHVAIYRKDGSSLIKIPFWLAIILIIGAPQLLVLVLLAMYLDWIDVRYEKCC